MEAIVAQNNTNLKGTIMDTKKTRRFWTLVLTLSLLPAMALAASGNGLTWAKSSHDSTLGTDKVGCSGCNAYVGDTSCTTALPVLCIKFDGSPNPGIATTYYNGWTKGHIALTTPVRGDKLFSLTYADYVCELHFGAGYQMAEFHDGGGGWNWHAYGNVDSSSRFWFYIDDQPGNCWN
jgi:hypothetical protein